MKFRLVSIFKCLLGGYQPSVLCCKWCPTLANTCGQGLFLCWEINYTGKFTSQLSGWTARSSGVRRQVTDKHSRPAFPARSQQHNTLNTFYVLMRGAQRHSGWNQLWNQEAQPEQVRRSGPKVAASCAFSHRPRRARETQNPQGWKPAQQWLNKVQNQPPTNTVQSRCLQSVLCES